MEDLIRQAFLHVDVIGPHVAEGHYDLIGPGNEIILPGVWETVVEPDWTITMHMWPMPEAAPDEAVIAVPDNPNPQTDEPKKPSKLSPSRPGNCRRQVNIARRGLQMMLCASCYAAFEFCAAHISPSP